MNTYQCIIIDDEPLAREIIRRYISMVPALELKAEFSDAIQAVSFLAKESVDLMFLDIEMPKLLGTEFIRTLNHPPSIIITTAYPQYAVEGFDLEVFDYLIKPIIFERFIKSINRLYRLSSSNSGMQKTQQEPHLFFRSDRKMIKVLVKDILYIESLKNYIRIVTSHRTILTKNSITSIEAMLPKDSFLRVHRSFIVLKSHIELFTMDSVTVGGVSIPIGRLYKNEVINSLQK